MTDNEIIKGVCKRNFCEPALEIINRQKAEIERLQKDNEYILMQHKFDRRPNGDCWNDVIEKAKSEAIREFAEKLKEQAFDDLKYDPILTRYVVSVDDIDRLVEEMTEGENE